MPPDAEMPEQGEVVMATISRIMDHGAYASLDEYGGMQGFLHISEIAPGWIRSVGRHIKAGEKKVLLVKRVSSRRADIDLSLKQITADQRKKKLKEVKQYEKGKTLLEGAAKRAGLSEKEAAAVEEAMYAKHDSIYDAFVALARGGGGAGLGLSGGALAAFRETASKIRPPSVQIRGIVEISSRDPDGVEVVKRALSKADGAGGAEVSYLGAPRYRLSVTADDFKAAEAGLKPIVEGIRRAAKGCSFQFTREESKKTRTA